MAMGDVWAPVMRPTPPGAVAVSGTDSMASFVLSPYSRGANNMARSYGETGSRCTFRNSKAAEGGYIQFATPLMWSHVEYARALLFRAKDWWKIK